MKRNIKNEIRKIIEPMCGEVCNQESAENNVKTSTICRDCVKQTNELYKLLRR